MSIQAICPFCKSSINYWVSDPCGSEPKGYVSIEHYCIHGLEFKYLEYGQDTTEVKEILKKIDSINNMIKKKNYDE